MRKDICEIRILPPFAIGRLGSSPDPMDNYDLVIPDPVGHRKLVPAETLVVNIKTGKIRSMHIPDAVRFRDPNNRIRPVSPFLEVWAQFERDGPLEPLTMADLKDLGLDAAAIRWRVQVGNIKAFRRTRDENDRIIADSGWFSDFQRRKLEGICNNFISGKSIPFGHVQFIQPDKRFPEIRMRFTPAAGYVYGPPVGPDLKKPPHPVIRDEVYDPRKGGWKGYRDPANSALTTSPSSIFANDRSPRAVSLGFLDDECDGLVDVELAWKGRKLQAYARIVAGPPTFGPDGLPVRHLQDDLEQALQGVEVTGPIKPEEIQDIVRRALETVRMMNTAAMNSPEFNSMALQDTGLGRAADPIMDPNVVDALAIQARHEFLLRALDSGSLAWFSRMLREYREVADLSDRGRRKMPGLMRGADSGYLALTRRQVNKVREVDAQTRAREENKVSQIKKWPKSKKK